jgi:hypothetical protein
MAHSLQVEKPIINPLSGLDFLSSTNFQVAQDTTGNRQGHKSVFKNDYPHYSHYGRGEQADRPVLAEVMHKDPSFFKVIFYLLIYDKIQKELSLLSKDLHIGLWLMVFSTIFNNISDIFWRSVLMRRKQKKTSDLLQFTDKLDHIML